MLFPTFKFFLFFIVVFYFSIFLRRNKLVYTIFLILASFVFYAFFDIRFVAIIIVSICLNYGFNYFLSKSVESQVKTRQRVLLTLGIVLNIALLGFFKYYNFFLDSIVTSLKDADIPDKLLNLNIIVPIGISFYTFRAISHLFDIYRGKLKLHGFLDYALYISFFPQLLAGPIARAGDFYEDLDTMEARSKIENNSEATEKAGKSYVTSKTYLLVLAGLFKKVVIASYLFEVATEPFLRPQDFSTLDLLVGVFAYAAMIYVDFSGYSDLSNAISNCLGFRTIQNFEAPYKASTISDFWARWHISLSTWIKDYIYIPLGGNRKGFIRTCINLLIVMTLAGLWHGASWVFVIWGVLHGVGLVINKFSEKLLGKEFFNTGIRFVIGNLSTIIFVLFTWIFFASGDLETARLYIQKIFSPSTSTVIYFDARLIAVIILVFSMSYLGKLYSKIGEVMFMRMPFLSRIAIGIVLIYIVWLLSPDEVPPFIYYNF